MIGVAGLRKVLPHRYPILLVDRVLELVPGEHLVAQKAITCNEPWYAALSDELSEVDPAYPPVLLAESWAQAAGVLAAATRPPAGEVMLAGSFSGLSFLDRVLPGEVVEHRVRVVRELAGAAIFEGEGVVAGRTVFTVASAVLAFRRAEALRDKTEVEAEQR